jgi:flagellar protein FlbB
MASLTDKSRAFYLILLIGFLLVIGFFIFDYFRIIDAEDYFPFLAKSPDQVAQDSESPTELEKLEIEKAQEKLIEDREELDMLSKELQKNREDLEAERERLEELKKGILLKESELAEKKKLEAERKAKVKVLADKVANMPPESARDMLLNWPDYDIIEVFEQMDKDAEEDGRQSITTYLLTLFPAERRAVITNKWLDSEAKNIPGVTGN